MSTRAVTARSLDCVVCFTSARKSFPEKSKQVPDCLKKVSFQLLAFSTFSLQQQQYKEEAKTTAFDIA
jgi:hypothetical protein